MKDFYHPRKAQLGARAVPHILGLTASPIIKSRPAELMQATYSPIVTELTRLQASRVES